MRAGEVLKEAAAVEELAEALVAFVIVRDGGAAVGEEFFFFICVVDVDEADRARSFFEHARENARGKSLIGKIRKDAVGECGVIFYGCVEGIRLAAGELARRRKHAACDLDERTGVVCAADGDAAAREEIEVCPRAAADVVDAHALCQMQQLHDPPSLHQERVQRDAAVHNVKSVEPFQLEKDVLPAPREGVCLRLPPVPDRLPFICHYTTSMSRMMSLIGRSSASISCAR